MTVSKALPAIPGIKDINVSLAKGEAAFEKLGQVPQESISTAVEKVGYRVE